MPSPAMPSFLEPFSFSLPTFLIHPPTAIPLSNPSLIYAPRSFFCLFSLTSQFSAYRFYCTSLFIMPGLENSKYAPPGMTPTNTHLDDPEALRKFLVSFKRKQPPAGPPLVISTNTTALRARAPTFSPGTHPTGIVGDDFQQPREQSKDSCQSLVGCGLGELLCDVLFLSLLSQLGSK